MADPIQPRKETPDVIVVGAGFAGMYLIHKLRGMGLRVQAIEAGSDVGGTWYWNRYPGARCDAMSQLYSFSFASEIEQAWTWTEKYARQPEILDYARFVADELDLRRDIWFDTRVTEATWDDDAGLWHLRTDRDDTLSARWCIMATGCLSAPKLPEIPGATETALPAYHTSAWPEEGADLAGKRIGVIGTGSSGIQVIPELAKVAGHLTVFQRTPNFVVPAGNAPLDPEDDTYVKAHYPELREAWRTGILVGAGEDLRVGNHYRGTRSALEVSAEERQAEYERRWSRGGAAFNAAFSDIILNEEANATSADFVRGKIRQIVSDTDTARKLTPHDHPIGTKRICLHDDYYQTFNRPNVDLIDLRSYPIVRITNDGVDTEQGHHALDALVYATGFDAMTGALLAMNITGAEGLRLADKWADGPVAYLGVGIAGFPNLFTITGPGSPSVLGNVVNHIEQHVEFVADLLAHAADTGADRIEVSEADEAAWMTRVGEIANATLYPRANSWYTGANVPGKPKIFMPFIGGIAMFRDICDGVAAAGFQGFEIATGATNKRAAG